MKIALLADVHANLEALRACLDHAAARGAGRYAFLGDLVGYGADPLACLEIVAGLVAGGAVAVQGNHDEAALGGLMERMGFYARDAIYWTRDRLGEAERGFLAGLPQTVREDDLLYVHASAERPEDWTYVTGGREAARAMHAGGAACIFSGHVHQPTLYYAVGAEARAFHPLPGEAIPLSPGRQWLAIAGSVGQPRDGNNAASYALFDAEARVLTYFRVPYDYPSAARKVRAAGLGEHLARRLEEGW
jgi:diadenosine tetraphosphatase ApaH/serine/threonine PP2A family protein phosphatase